MDRDIIMLGLKQIITTYTKADLSTISWETNLFDDLDMDSLDIMSVAMDVEKLMNVHISDKELADIKTVLDLRNAVVKGTLA